MALKPQSHQPTTEDEEPSTSEYEESESGSESSYEVKSNLPNQEEKESPSEDEDKDQENLKTNTLTIEEESVAQENGMVSDSDSDDSPSAYKLQPVSGTPLAGKKRIHEDSDKVSVESSKKAKIDEEKGVTFTSGGGGGITRLWSNEDEIAVLNGMVEFKNVKGVDPYADMGAFHDFVKGKLQVDFSKEQLKGKISRLKNRFLNAVKKCENPVLLKPHEEMAFELSKRIWGGVVGNTNQVPVIVKEDVNEDCEGGFDWSDYPYLSHSFGKLAGNFPSLVRVNVSFMKEKFSLIGKAKAKELNEKWIHLIAEEAEVNNKMMNLMMEQVRMALAS